MNSITRKYANNMINSLFHNKSNANQDAYKFFKHANDNNIQGAALVSYYTKLNSMPELAKDTIIEKIYTISKNDKNLDSEVKKFASKFTEQYPKTEYDRISLASNSEVIDGEVKPKSVFKKFLTILNRFMKEEE